MSLKSILVHTVPSDRLDAVLDVACGLVRAHGAHLIGLHVSPDPAIPFQALPGPVPAEYFDALVEQADTDRDRCEAAFKAATDRHDINGEWRAETGDMAERISVNARYADLAVMAQAASDDMLADAELATVVATTAGRPVLVVPRAGNFPDVGKRVLVCWDASREATRAVNDAMPLLQSADVVTVLAVNPDSGGEHGEVPSADISHFLARHGVQAEANKTYAEDIDVADAILSRASDLSSDLIVMGAYGHTRMREWVFGGVTRSIMRSMTRPVLISH